MEIFNIEVERNGVMHLIEGNMSGDDTHDPQESTFEFIVNDVFVDEGYEAQITMREAERIADDAIYNPLSQYDISITEVEPDYGV